MVQNTVVATLMQEQRATLNIFLCCHLLESARGLRDQTKADISFLLLQAFAFCHPTL